ncbi:uncharacterized protein LOC127837580 [Dreissena polymorpha]|uniref:Uncharacterized protein n=1 Tax=Dreissena polymorpha TaxID=45954 RepID=A0A9D4FK76_DREPO|nr:uncharacterized protein LOC127837580 [Dreissena polymorpha]KAH3800679.1 hypothetical protein DPMN_154317 [Dreissena polymorpha]
MDMEDVTSDPSSPQLLHLMSPEQKVRWLNEISLRIIDNLKLNELSSVNELRDNLLALNAEDDQLKAMKQEDIYKCPLCNRTYKCKQVSWFKKHLIKKHHWTLHTVSTDVKATNAVQHFLFMSLLFRDTMDSYKMGDGERILRNAYFEWLFDSSVKHTKYKLWLWRMISYVISILGVEDSFEYLWNMTVNFKGGIYNNIPNDNCVELQVNNIKRELATQGANKSYQSAKNICMTTQVVDAIREQLVRTSKTVRSRRERPVVDKTNDIVHMVKFLRQQGPVKDLAWKSYSSFKDPIKCIDADELHIWINRQKTIASI